MKRLVGDLMMALIVVLSVGCARPLTEKESGTKVSFPIDGTFQVVLDGNPTTGYLWEVETMDTEKIGMPDEPAYESANKTAMVGGGGEYTFTFKVKAAGVSTLRLVYHRPWEHDVEPLRTFTLEIMGGTMGQIESP